MRRKLVLGAGLAALVGGSATGQFAVDRAPLYSPPSAPKSAPAIPGGLTPVAPAAPVVGGYQPTAPTSPSGSLYASPSSGAAYVPPVEAPRAPTYGSPTYGSPSYGTPAPVAAPNLSALSNIEIPTAMPKNHAWTLKAEHGAYFIMVKSYVRPAADSRAAKEAAAKGEKLLTALEMAEALAGEIRDTHRVQTLLFEYISEERKAEIRAYLASRQKAQSEYRSQIAAMEQRAKLSGLDFAVPDNILRIRKHDGTDQIGVLVGGFQTEADALKALNVLKKWPTPKNTALLDKGILHVRNPDNPKDTGQNYSGATYMNPYETAFVVPNPAVSRAQAPTAKQGLDPFVVKLNEGRPYSLLKATKGWTLAVKSFTAPVELTNKDGGEMTMARKFGAATRGAEVLAAGAEQAESLAKALRAMKGKHGEALNLEAFVLHTRTASIVTVGQFDSPDDPVLLAVKRLLVGMVAKYSEDQTGMRPVSGAPSLFDNVLPIPIPK